MSEPTIPPTCIGCAPIVAKLRADAEAMQREWEEDQSELARATSDCVKYLEHIANLESERDRLAARLKRAEELGSGKPTVLELSRGADRRIAKLEAERDAALTAKRQADTYADDITGCLECIAEAVTGDSDTAGIVNKVEALVAENARLRDLLARVQVEDRWQPIETAPKDGTRVIISDQYAGEAYVSLGSCQRIASRQTWIRDGRYICEPTHWRPLPLTPAEEAELDALWKAVAMEGETP